MADRSKEVKALLPTAREYARLQRKSYASSIHMLQAVLLNNRATVILNLCSVDVRALVVKIEAHVTEVQRDASTMPDRIRLAASTQNLLTAARQNADKIGKVEYDVVDIIYALAQEHRSIAARFMKEAGLDEDLLERLNYANITRPWSRAALEEYESSLKAVQDLERTLPFQGAAPVRVEERDGKLFQVSEHNDSIGADELDFDRWRAPVAESLTDLLAIDLGPGTNHERLRRRLLALADALAGTIDELKANQFRLGYGIESLGDLVGVYRDAADDMPTLNAAVFADVNRLHIQLMLGLSKLAAWSRFQQDADADELHEGAADPAAVGTALAEAEAVLSADAAAPIVDPELPRSFRWIRDAIADPAVTTKRMVYGAVKSLENVVSFLGQIALRPVKAVGKDIGGAISKAVASRLLVALGGAALSLSAALPTQWAWLKPLLEAAAKVLHG